MKKVISVVLSFFILTVSISCCFSTVAEGIEDFQYRKASNELQNFAKEVYALTSEHDSDLESSHNSSDTIEATEFMSAASVENELDINYECFETNRLIVYSNEKFDTYGAIEHLSGYEDMHLLQYENLEDTINAYTYLSEDEDIDSVEPDVIISLEEFEEKEKTETLNDIDYPHDTSITPSWGYDRIETYDAFQYILQNKPLEELPEIVIGIVDDGVTLGNKYFGERLIGAYSLIGRPPLMSLGGHGANVAGVILENTLPNVKIISYQVFFYGTATVSMTSLAEEQARLDGCDIINSSYGHLDSTGDTSGSENIFDDSVSLQIAAAGNESSRVRHYPSAFSGVISVASLKDEEYIANYSNKGNWVDVAAPGTNITIPYTGAEGETTTWSGTSCATPFVSATCAMIMTQYPTLSNTLVAEILFKSCDELKPIQKHLAQYGIINMFEAVTYYDTDVKQTATPEFSIESRPVENEFYDETQYIELTCADSDAEIYYTLDKTTPSKTNGTLYTEPIELTETKSIYAIAYKENYFKSAVAKRYFCIRVPLSDFPNENGWHIRDNGMIWGYSGPDTDLVVPETVLGIDVKGIESEAFFEQEYINSITMPDCLTIIEDKAFYKCSSLTSIDAPGVTEVGVSAFYMCKNLDTVSMPNLQKINTTSFKHTGALNGFPFENLTKIPSSAFANSDVFKVNLANAINIQKNAFSYCDSLTEVSLPVVEIFGGSVFRNCKLLNKVELNPEKDTIETATFDGCNFSKLEFFNQIDTVEEMSFRNNSSLIDIEMNSLTYLGTCSFENCKNLTTMTLPSVECIDHEALKNCTSLTTLILSDCVKEIGSDAFAGCENLKYLLVNGEIRLYGNVFAGSSVERLEMNGVGLADSLPIIENSIIAMPSTFYKCTENTKGRNYQVYGTSGTYAETWAKENGHTFINVSQDTAILKNVPMEYTGNGEILSVDVIGFNRTYQWYSNTEANNTTGTPIDGATSKDFNPADYPEAHYYYCVITSTDKGYDPIEIRTGTTANKDGHTEVEIPALEPNCIKSGVTSGVKCSVCGEIIIEQQEIPALGHDYNSVVIAPACTENGYTTYTCICGDTYVDDYVDALGHKYEAIITAPTYTSQGYTTYTCDCGDCYVAEYIDKLEYDYSFSIQEPSTTKIRFKDGIILHTTLTGTYPDDAYIKWSCNNNNFNFEESSDGTEITIIARKKGYTVFTATIYDANDNILAEDSVEMYSNSGLFQKIGGFFRSFFGTTTIYEN